jgi:hypothetical protein
LDSWIKVGTNLVYCGIADGRVVAIVYCTDEELGSDEAGQPIVTTPGWFWIPGDCPFQHRDLKVPERRPDDDRGALHPLHGAALGSAEEAIHGYLDISGE